MPSMIGTGYWKRNKNASRTWKNGYTMRQSRSERYRNKRPSRSFLFRLRFLFRFRFFDCVNLFPKVAPVESSSRRRQELSGEGLSRERRQPDINGVAVVSETNQGSCP